METNHSISGVQISGALANDEYRLTWLFNCAYQPQLSPVPVILGEALGTVATNSTPSLEGLYYPVGSSVTLEATDGAGKFVRWYGPGVTTENAYNNPITIPVRGDIPLTTADGPLKIKAFFRSPRFRYNGSTISDGYLAYSVTSLGGTDLELGSSVSHPPDMDFDFTKPIIHASSGAEYSIVRSSAKFFRLPFDGDDPEDSARRIRYPATLDRDGLLGDHSVGSLDNSYRFLDFGGDISYHSFTNSHIGTDGGGSWRTLVTIPNGTWGEILTNATVFKPWSELSDEGKQKWKNLGLGGRHPIGVTIGKWGGASLWIRYAAESPTLIIIR